MDRKQKLSMSLATCLPLVALSAYVILVPMRAVRAAAGDCPDGQVYAPQPSQPNYCNNGANGAVPPSEYSLFVFCNTEDGTGANGLGQCMAGSCVKCSYGVNGDYVPQ